MTQKELTKKEKVNWNKVFKDDMKAEAFHQRIVDKSDKQQLKHLEETMKTLNESVDLWLDEE